MAEAAQHSGVAVATPPARRRVTVLGLGIMGSAIARHLVEAGFRVSGHDPDPARARDAGRAGVVVADSGAAAAQGAEVLLTSLPADAALDATVDALLAAQDAGPAHEAHGLVWLELSTLSPECKERNRTRLAARGITLLDCPISGTGAQAQTRDLAVYGSGPRAAWDSCQDVVTAFARTASHVGEFGHGMRLKLIANLLVAVNNVATAEALALARRAGLDLGQTCELLGAGAAGSRILALRGPMMARDAYEPATMKLDVWAKDLSLIEAFARHEGARTPLFDATLPLYAAALQAGLGKQDTAAGFRTLSEDPS